TLGQLCRQTLSQIPHVQLYDLKTGKTGTVPFNIRGMDATVAVKLLQDEGIATCFLNEEAALRGLRKLNQPRVVRAALHYFNTEDEIEQLSQALTSIGKHSSAASRSQ